MAEWGSIGFMVGVLVCIIFFSAGVIIGDKRHYCDDSDMRIYVPNGSGSGGSNNRCSEPSPEDIETVLYLLRLGASDHERQIIDYLIDREGKK